MEYIRMVFEKEGELVAELNPQKAPETVKNILESLPLESRLTHTRWCGREVYFDFPTKGLPPAENHTGIVSKFDVAYWRDPWDSDLPEGKRPAETLSFYYGPEHLSFHGGWITVNVIGRILWEQEKMLETIGERIWKEGTEKVWIEKWDRRK